jgi:hypothetical protein
MMKSFKMEKWTLQIGFPVYGVQFIEEDKFIVCGGGGAGRSGVKNMLVHMECINDRCS